MSTNMTGAISKRPAVEGNEILGSVRKVFPKAKNMRDSGGLRPPDLVVMPK